MEISSNSIDALYGATTDADTLAKIKEYASDGLSDEELFELEEMGIDISLMKTTTATTTATAKVTATDVSSAVSELKEKYSASAGGSDPYTSSNPQVMALKQLVDDGVLEELANQGFAKLEIVDIISQVFPSVGISLNDDGGYTLPIGHDEEAKEIFANFQTQLMAAAGETDEMKAIKAQIAELNTQIEANNQQLAVLKPMIEKVQKEVEDKIEDAINESQDIAEDQKEEANKTVKSELEKYTSAEGKISYEEFQSSLHSKLTELSDDGDSKMADVVCELVDAEAQMFTLKGYVNKMGQIIKSNEMLSATVSDLSSDYAEMKEELASSDAEDPDASKCDPIGFTEGDTRYDFFVDKDNDGKISNEKEFLGAESGWNEMTSLDANSDGKITGDEMSGLKVVVTNADGTQETKDASDVFGDGDSVNLNSYKSVNQEMDNGNTLLGTFSVTKDGEEIKDGYNTLDEVDWLENNYDFSDKDNGINKYAQDNTTQVTPDDYSADYTQYQANIVNLEAKLQTAWRQVGVDRDEVKDGIEEVASADGAEQAKTINENFERIAKKEDAADYADAEAAKALEEKEEENE